MRNQLLIMVLAPIYEEYIVTVVSKYFFNMKTFDVQLHLYICILIVLILFQLNFGVFQLIVCIREYSCEYLEKKIYISYCYQLK